MEAHKFASEGRTRMEEVRQAKGTSKQPSVASIPFLKTMRLFQRLNRSDLALVAELLAVRRCRKGATIISEGGRGSCVYIVKKGQFKVTHVVRGKIRELGTFQVGDHFGEVSFVDRKPRCATIFATEESELFVITRKAFDRLLKEAPHVQFKLMQALLENLCEKLRDRNEILDSDVTDLLPVSVFELDAYGNILFANRSGLENFGYTPGDFAKGINAFQLIIPEERARASEIFQSVLKLGRSASL